MEKTANYKLPQWSKSDFIQMDDFNAAFAGIDTQMKKNADAAGAAADAETVTAQIETVQEQLVAVEQEIKLVALGETRTTAAVNGSIVYDLSALNMADYRALLAFASAEQKDGYTGNIALVCDSTTIGSIASITGGRMSTVAWIFPAQYGVAAAYQTVKQGFRGDAEDGSSVALNESTVWNGMQSIAFQFTAQSGGSVILYGLKK